MNFRTLDLLGNGLDLEIKGERIAQIDIPSDYVSENFAPILGTHLLLTGDKLVNGMIVVIEDHSIRGNPSDISPENPDRDSYERRRIEEGARWALVTDLKFVPNGPDSRLAKFTAIYSDGTMRDRTYNVSYKWAVLKEFRIAVVGERCDFCGEVHSKVKTPENIDEITSKVTTEIFGEEMSFEEFFGRAKEDPSFLTDMIDTVMDKVVGNLLGGVLEDLEDDIKDETAEESVEDVLEPDNERQPGETEEEHLERLRDAEEARNEYASNESLRILREKLMVPEPEETAAAAREKAYGDEQTGARVRREQTDRLFPQQ